MGYERKLFTDTVKLSAYEIETRLDEMLGTTFSNDATESRGGLMKKGTDAARVAMARDRRAVDVSLMEQEAGNDLRDIHASGGDRGTSCLRTIVGVPIVYSRNQSSSRRPMIWQPRWLA